MRVRIGSTFVPLSSEVLRGTQVCASASATRTGQNLQDDARNLDHSGAPASLHNPSLCPSSLPVLFCSGICPPPHMAYFPALLNFKGLHFILLLVPYFCLFSIFSGLLPLIAPFEGNKRLFHTSQALLKMTAVHDYLTPTGLGKVALISQKTYFSDVSHWKQVSREPLTRPS